MNLPIYKELSKKEQFAAEAKRCAVEYWKEDPPLDQVRIARTKQLMHEHVPKRGRVIDIGAGRRPFMCDLAVDILPQIDGVKEALFPYLNLPDSSFSCAICTDVIAELPSTLHRLAVSELARILEPDGYLICSTALDRKTYDAKECFEGLISTEFQVIARRLTFAPFLYSERLGQIFRGVGGASHIIVVAKKSRLH